MLLWIKKKAGGAVVSRGERRFLGVITIFGEHEKLFFERTRCPLSFCLCKGSEKEETQ